MHIHLGERDLNSGFIQHILTVLRDPPFSLPEIFIFEPAPHTKIDSGILQCIHKNKVISVLHDIRICRKHSRQNFLRLLQICAVRDRYHNITTPAFCCSDIYNSIIGQISVGQNNGLIVIGQQFGIENLDLFYGTFLARGSFYNIISYPERLQ